MAFNRVYFLYVKKIMVLKGKQKAISNVNNKDSSKPFKDLFSDNFCVSNVYITNYDKQIPGRASAKYVIGINDLYNKDIYHMGKTSL